MEPATLTAAAIATLAFSKAIEKTAETLTASVLNKLNNLREIIWQRFKGNQKLEPTLAKAQKEGSKAEVDLITAYLQVAMDTDDKFAQDIQQLAQEINQEINIGKIEGRNVQNVYGGEAFQSKALTSNKMSRLITTNNLLRRQINHKGGTFYFLDLPNDANAPTFQGGSGHNITLGLTQKRSPNRVKKGAFKIAPFLRHARGDRGFGSSVRKSYTFNNSTSQLDVNNAVENNIEENNTLPIDCYVHAEMDDHVIVQRVTTVEVIISEEVIEFVSSVTAKSKQIQIDALKSLIVQVIPKVNFESVGDARIEIESLSLETPQHLYFDLRPTHLGEGEIWVIFRQSQRPLLTLTLTPQIVESKAQVPQRLSANGSIQNIPKLSEPLHQLRIIERRNGTQITYDYELDSPSLNILGRYESKPIASDRQHYIETLYKEIESRWCSVEEDVNAFAAELRGFGGKLLDELFPEPLQRQIWEHRQEIQSIMVISTEPFIPWELVHLKPPGQAFLPDEVCFLGQLGLVRWLYDVGFPPKSITLQPERCRYVIPHYPDSRYRLPQAEQEAEFLKQTFQATAIEPQPNSVRQALESASFDLLHFAGHGEAEHGSTATANLLLEGRIEGEKYIQTSLSATTVCQYCRFKIVKNQPIVLLNACQIGRTGYDLTGISGFAQAFLKGGAGAFIGSLWSVGDRPARVFSETLYSALVEGSDLAEASRKAREKAKAAGDATWLAYVVYGHPYLKVALQKVK